MVVMWKHTGRVVMLMQEFWPFDSTEEIFSSFNLFIVCIYLYSFILLLVISFTHLPPLLLLLVRPSPPSPFLCFPSAGAVATQLWWQEHPGRRRGQVLYRSPADPVVGMDTAAPNLPGRLGRQTSVESNQSGETFISATNDIIWMFVCFLCKKNQVCECALFVYNVHITGVACSHANYHTAILLLSYFFIIIFF